MPDNQSFNRNKKREEITAVLVFGLSLILYVTIGSAAVHNPVSPQDNSRFRLHDTLKSSLKYISTNFENAS